MQNKIIFIFISIFVVFTSLQGGQKQQDIVQIVANSIDQNGSIITANGDVLIFSPKHYLTANKAIFNRDKSTVELFGKVSISKSNENVSISKYAFVNLSKDINKFSPILLIDKTTQIWINGTSVSQEKDVKNIQDATLSSCDCQNPEWSIGFSSADYNTTDQWINMYNNTVYIKNIPAWYFLIPAIPFAAPESLLLTGLILKTPYFGFPTSKERRTGLLIPKVGYGEEEGWFYMQPIYYAPSDNIDFTYIPQYRSLRGHGHSLEFRLADSAYSRLKIDLGTFYEQSRYFDKYNLKNEEHNGWSLTYNRSKLFTSGNSSDGLYLEAQDMDDVEYINTSYGFNDDGTTTVDKLLKSELKYYYNNQYLHFNTGVDYYKDISKTDEENKKILQQTPYTQIHQYSHNIFDTNILISSALKQKRYTRETNINANLYEFEIPLKYSRYFLNNYLLFGLDKTLSLSKIEYKKDDSQLYQNGQLIKDSNSIYLDMDLLKSYDSFIHNININARYTKVEYHNEKGDLYGFNINSSDLSPFPFSKEQENINFMINQSFYDSTDHSTLVNHKIRQSVVYDENGTSSLGNLENQLVFYLPYSSISNKLLYNHDDDMVTSSLSALKTKYKNTYFNLDYTYTRDKNTTTDSYKDGSKSESILATIGTKVLKYYTISYKEQYNITDHLNTIREYGLNINEKCWALDIKLADNLVARATQDEKELRQKIIYATLTLKPIGSIKQRYEREAK